MFGDIVYLYFFYFFLVLNSLFMLCFASNLLMAFDRLLLKRLLTYLLTYLQFCEKELYSSNVVQRDLLTLSCV